MRSSEIEALVLEVAECIANGHSLEDSRIELKSEWPADLYRAARRLAGHANAARGEDVIWLIGMDETKGPVGAKANELADWSAGIAKHFDGTCPALIRDLAVQLGAVVVHALVFATDRAPFVVQSAPNSGPVEREVPWREGTRVRSARRADLLRILVPQLSQPDIDVLSMMLSVLAVPAKGNKADGPEVFHWRVYAELYVVPSSTESGPLVFPIHRVATRGRSETGEEIVLDEIELHEPQYLSTRPGEIGMRSLSRTIEHTEDEVIIHGPGKLLLEAKVLSAVQPPGTGSWMVTTTLARAGVEDTITVVTQLPALAHDRNAKPPRWIAKS